MATLQYRDLFKRNNWDIFLDKIATEHSFLDKSIKKDVIINLDKTTVERMKKAGAEKALKAFKKGSSYFFPVKQGNPLRLSNIYKSADFGGVGSTIKKETKQLNSLNKQIQDYLKKNKVDYVDIKIENKTHKVVMAETTPKTPKSDIHLINTDGKECVWISLKDGTSPKSFQQYGGFTEKGMYDREKELKDFVAFVKSGYSEIPSGMTMGSKISSRAIKGKTIYGVDFGRGTRGVNNVNLVLQGNIILKEGKLTGSAHTWNNGHIPSGGYEPIMIVRRGDRNQFQIKRARFLISPIGGRKITEMI